MPKLAHAAEHHRDAGFVRSRDHIFVVQRAAGLNDRRRASLDDGKQAVGKSKEGV